VFDAVAGVEPQSETVWRQADRYRVPRICFANKMDRVGADYWQTIQAIARRLGAHPVAIQVPIGAESEFCGVVDLIEQKAVLYCSAEHTDPAIADVPEELATEVARRREEMIERLPRPTTTWPSATWQERRCLQKSCGRRCAGRRWPTGLCRCCAAPRCATKGSNCCSTP